jgi:hypothetical protein
LAAYITRYRSPLQLKILQVSEDLITLSWSDLWSTYQQGCTLDQPGAIVYPGSLGDGISEHLTVADWAHDWRMPVVLTVPSQPRRRQQLFSQIAAFSALARQAKAELVGIVVCQMEEDDTREDPRWPQAIWQRAQVRLLGSLPVAAAVTSSPPERADLAAKLDWESLTGAGW